MQTKKIGTINEQKRRDTITAWLFLAPTLISFGAFVVFPVFFSAFLSFTQWDFISGISSIKFVGIRNFVKMFQDEEVINALKNTFIYTVTIVPISLCVSLVVAYMLNDKVHFKKTIRMMFFIPYISNTVALATVFKGLFRSDGPINMVLRDLGVSELPQWFSDPNLAKLPIIILAIWTGIGYQMLIYLAALQDVPTELYEAAEIDGASPLKRFLKVTIPLISPSTFYLLVVRTIAVFKLFSSVKIMSGSSSERISTTLVLEIYRAAFGEYEFGYASAMSWVLFAIILMVTLVQMWGQKKWVHY
ncbi:MAG: sugar ABC transporter permease [Lachnospiraceae bacterium]|nr:sugar ABC transporter permease [Lachnospiraceae bacterium]